MSLHSLIVGVILINLIFSADKTSTIVDINLESTYWKVHELDAKAVWKSDAYISYANFKEDSIWFASSEFGCFPQAYWIKGNVLYKQSDVVQEAHPVSLKITAHNDSIMTLTINDTDLYARRVSKMEFLEMKELYCD